MEGKYKLTTADKIDYTALEEKLLLINKSR